MSGSTLTTPPATVVLEEAAHRHLHRRPPFFLIRDEQSGSILFVGRVPNQRAKLPRDH